jgi:hypothetical protein
LTWPDEKKIRGPAGLNNSAHYGLEMIAKKQTLPGMYPTRNIMACPSSELITWNRYRSIFLNTTFDDFVWIYGLETREGLRRSPELSWRDPAEIQASRRTGKEFPVGNRISSLSIPTSPRPHAHADLSTFDARILEFCKLANGYLIAHLTNSLDINRMCSTSILLDGQNNGYRSIILPSSMQSTLIMSSLLAVSANHLKLRDPAYGIVALHYRELSLKVLRMIITSDLHSISKLDIIVTILMLCYFDISDGCHTNWMNHLKGAYKIMISEDETQNSNAIRVPSFISQYFAGHSVMGYTAVSDPELEDLLFESAMFWMGHIRGEDQEIDCVLGCSKELMGMILKITYEVRQQRRHLECMQRLDRSLWKENLETKLKYLRQTPPQGFQMHEAQKLDYDGIKKIERTAEAFRQASLILLQYFNPSADSFFKIQGFAQDVFEIMKKCPVCPTGERTSALWPLFIAACHAVEDDDRAFVLNRFSEMEMARRFGNIRPVRKVIEHVWKKRDLMVDISPSGFAKLPSQSSLGICFEWEDAMAALGCTLSLT